MTQGCVKVNTRMYENDTSTRMTQGCVKVNTRMYENDTRMIRD